MLTVEGDNEKKAAADPETEKESVVNNVFSTISNWMKEDPASEETDDVEDDEDDDDEEDDEEEEEEVDENIDLTVTEEKSQNDSLLQKSEGINSLHNLPLGVPISSYSLQTEPKVEKLQGEPPKPEGEPDVTVLLSTDYKEEKLQSVPPKPEGESDVTVLPSTENMVKDAHKTDIPVVKNIVEHTTVSGSNVAQNPSTDTFLKLNEKPSEPETNLPSSAVHPPSSLPDTLSSADTTKLKDTSSTPIQIPQVAQDTSTNTEDTQSVVHSERTDTADKDNATSDTILVETVTEYSVGIEEEFPVVQEVTPNPVESTTDDLKKEVIVTETKATEEVVEKTENLEINTTDPLDVEEPQLQKDTVDAGETNPETLPIMPPQNVDNTQKETIKNEEAVGSFSPQPPLGGLFNSAQSHANSENKNREEPEGEMLSPNYVPRDDIVTEEDNEALDKDSTQVTIGDANLMSNIEQNEDINISSEDKSPEEVVLPKNSPEDVGEVKEEEHITENDHTSEKTEDLSLEDENIVGDFIEDVNSKEEGGGLFSSILSLFSGSNDESEINSDPTTSASNEESSDIIEENVWSPQIKESVIDYCDASVEVCNTSDGKDHTNEKSLLEDIEISFNSDIFIYLLTTSISVIVFLFGYMFLDRSRREAPLVARINKLEKELLITLKENELLQEKGSSLIVQEVEQIPNDAVKQLTQQLAEVQSANRALEIRVQELGRELEGKEALEEQIESLEKELETSTEVGMELNRIISEMLDPKDGSEKLKENVEQLQRQLLEQKDTINSINTELKQKESENQAMQVDLEKSKKKSVELQSKLEEMVDKVLQIEKEKDQQQSTLQNEISVYHQKYSEAVNKVDILNNEIQVSVNSSY